MSREWSHAPIHRFGHEGAYMVTAGTYRRRQLLTDEEHLSLVQETLLELAQAYGWTLRAWAVLCNHYHFVALPPDDPESLRDLIRHLHSDTARKLNRIDDRQGRKVWYQFWDRMLTYRSSYLARLKYVHYNALHHGVVDDPEEYPWCSARWFHTREDRELRQEVKKLDTDSIKVQDDF